MGADLEELMMMEAMRRSMQDLSTGESEQAGGPSDAPLPALTDPSEPVPRTESPAASPAGDSDGETTGKQLDSTESPVIASFVEAEDVGASS